MLTIKAGSNTTMPTGRPISAYDLLAAYVELGQPATRKVYSYTTTQERKT